MPRLPEPKSFDVTGKRYDRADDIRSLLQTAAYSYKSPDPSIGINISMSGDHVVVKFICHDRMLDDRRRLDGTMDAAEKAIKDYLSFLKKEVKGLGGGSPKFKELKDRRDYVVNKISLNDRWQLMVIRVFKVEEITDYPED